MPGVEERRYVVRISEMDRFRLAALPEPVRPIAEQFIDDHLRRHPEQRFRRHLKMLFGADWAGYYQFDLDRTHRLVYTIDETSNEVRIEYLGAHPDWSRSRPGAITD
jgi:hypothetical protein